MSLRIAIFDDNINIRDSIGMLLKTEKDFQVVGSFAHVLDCIAEIKICRPDVILMDIEMPGMTGIEAVRIIKKEFPDILILMQTVFEDDERVFDSICAGVQFGGSPMSPSIARKVLNKMQQIPEHISPEAAPDYHLTPREKEVLACIVNGLAYKMIAGHLFISYETVRTHVKRIYEKLHVASLTEVVHKAMKERIV